MEYYKFFTNKKCEYYPCHDLDEINCLFCFCPLYHKKDCGGNCSYIKDVKDCSQCTKPHQKENYDLIIQELEKTRHQ
jgi:Zn-finger protein